ncbi:hypothetical protein Krac_3931 [Ktedonobacter racemifer DSM 44963]|uniref:Uncharacterized protein n=1 Tax=Ktedonobacter racemifer DSM 44963 TaxID=485913 RepID=D6U3N0_KTERA|nr:hypothetical protein Krac_3931 [Ktedonobacter racemifer DSM 44963]
MQMHYLKIYSNLSDVYTPIFVRIFRTTVAIF